jgi:hypothetical protein
MDEMAGNRNALNKDAVATMPKAAALHLKPNGGKRRQPARRRSRLTALQPRSGLKC